MRYLYHAMRMNLKSIAQYRASFLMQNIAQFIMVGGEFLAVVVLTRIYTGVFREAKDHENKKKGEVSDADS